MKRLKKRYRQLQRKFLRDDGKADLTEREQWKLQAPSIGEHERIMFGKELNRDDVRAAWEAARVGADSSRTAKQG
jgi:hypothetical protein